MQKIFTFCFLFIFFSQSVSSQVQTFQCSYKVISASFSPDGKFILSSCTANSNGNIDLWDITGGLVTSYKGLTTYNNYGSFSPDGKYLITASVDKTLKLWNSNIEITSTSDKPKKYK